MKVLIERTGLSKGFNRYMVECEFFFIMNENAIKSVLIDTWWNVNFI